MSLSQAVVASESHVSSGKRCIYLSLALAMCGCAAQTYRPAQQTAWQKAGASAQDFNTDAGACRYQLSPFYQQRRDTAQAQLNQPTQMAGNVAVRQSPLQGSAVMVQIANINAEEQNAIRDCMYSKGWSLQ